MIWAAYGGNDRTFTLTRDVLSALSDKRLAQTAQALENYIYNEHVPWVWLWHQQDIYGVSNNVDWKPRPDELLTFEEASFR
jgi:hypothetical protein